jgi:Uma2 family endonuclease
MPVSEKSFQRIALAEPGQWELHYGKMRRKPGMSADHNHIAAFLFGQLYTQLDLTLFEPRVNLGHVRRSPENYYIPDVFVAPAELFRPQRGTRRLEVYRDPLPLVVEVWSPSTGDYDVDAKLPEYQRRGDLEIWRIHPYEHSLTVWQRQPDGTYAESMYLGGTVRPMALPNVVIDLDALFN